MSINSHGFWEGTEVSSQHYNDISLGVALTEFFNNEKATSVVDLGCGMGYYVKIFKENNINASGFDGNPNTPELTNGMCNILDLSNPIKFDKPYNWVMSLEVGEHLPKKYEDIFISNLHMNNESGIVLSWAVKGQPGDGHVNCQNNDYIKNKICSLGYTNDSDAENILRSKSSLWWFKNTIMVFRK